MKLSAVRSSLILPARRISDIANLRIETLKSFIYEGDATFFAARGIVCPLNYRYLGTSNLHYNHTSGPNLLPQRVQSLQKNWQRFTMYKAREYTHYLASNSNL
jgi:hypothetical protein